MTGLRSTSTRERKQTLLWRQQVVCTGKRRSLVHVKVKNPSLNGGGSLREFLSTSILFIKTSNFTSFYETGWLIFMWPGRHRGSTQTTQVLYCQSLEKSSSPAAHRDLTLGNYDLDGWESTQIGTVIIILTILKHPSRPNLCSQVFKFLRFPQNASGFTKMAHPPL